MCSEAVPHGVPAAPPVSIVIPALDEAATIVPTLAALAPARAAGWEIVLADGGSRDATIEHAQPLVDRVVEASPGRARQMNAGAAVARGRLLWFLHADTRVEGRTIERLAALVEARRPLWGRVGVRLDSRRPLLRLVGWMMNLRSRLTGIATGDQGLFIERGLFDAVGGFPEQPLMEDVEISARLRRRRAPECLPTGLVTSARRWERGGAGRTIVLMWRLRFAYWRGADPASLAARYRDARR